MKYLIYLIAIIFLLSLNLGLFNHLEIKGQIPNLLFLFTLCCILEKENYDKLKIEKVLHCVRSHRCRDVMPETLEAKIMAFIDSASHMTDSMYFGMAKDDKNMKQQFRVYSKMERDLRDLSTFPEAKEKLLGLYDAWQKLIKEYEKIDLS